MTYRSFAGVAAVSGIICAAVVSLAPSAAAIQVTGGVECEGTTCTNSNDEDYFVSGSVLCQGFNGSTYDALNNQWTTPGYTTNFQTFTDLIPAQGSGTVTPGCSAPDTMLSWNYTGGYPASYRPTGSAG